jgi:hypothetical protein
MKIIDIPQTGKLGLVVSYKGRNGLIRRSRVVPANPRTPDQTLIRSNLASQARSWRGLTDPQQAAWITAAANIRSNPTLGQSGPLTGFQMFTKINCALLAIGNDPVQLPPAIPVIDPLPITGLEITNTAGAITLKLATTDTPPEGTMLWGCPPQSAGVHRPVSPRFLGPLGIPTANKVDITSAYTARFGTLAANLRIFVQVNANVDGFEGPRLTFSGRIPTSS